MLFSYPGQETKPAREYKKQAKSMIYNSLILLNILYPFDFIVFLNAVYDQCLQLKLGNPPLQLLCQLAQGEAG